MRRLVVAVIVACSVLVPALAAAGSRPHVVRLANAAFSTRAVTLHVGDAIRFRWSDGALHNVTRRSGPAFAKIGDRTSGSVTRRFTKAGRYVLLCTWHRSDGMRIVVTVR